MSRIKKIQHVEHSQLPIMCQQHGSRFEIVAERLQRVPSDYLVITNLVEAMYFADYKAYSTEIAEYGNKCFSIAETMYYITVPSVECV